MFYPVESLKRGGRFYLCWVADSWPLRFATITHRQLWSQDIRKICDDLLEVMINESGRPANRFSLRLSSQLLRGLVRLYQRKVTVLLSDLCMINANVTKNINKKWNIHDVAEDKSPVRPLPKLTNVVIQEEPENEQRIEEIIQNSGNIVGNIQDITLKEATVPQLLLPPNDGFGEENQDQALQLLKDQTVEMMLVQDGSAIQHSGLDLPGMDATKLHDKSYDCSHEKSRLALEPPQMERISEHDVTLFRKSVGDRLTLGGVEKDIPEIPEIQLPDLPVPQPENALEEPQAISEVQAPAPVQEKPAQTASPENIELEELEEQPQQTKRRRVKNRLIIDKKIKLTADYLVTRIGNPYVELRCEESSEDIADVRLPADILFRRPSHAGRRIYLNIGAPLTRLFQKNLGFVNRLPLSDSEMENVIPRRAQRVPSRSMLERIEEEPRAPEEPAVIQQLAMEVDTANQSGLNVNQSGLNIEPNNPVEVEHIDISEMATQKILLPESEMESRKRTSQEDNLPMAKRPRTCRSGYVSYRHSQQLAIETAPIVESDKENLLGTAAAQQPRETDVLRAIDTNIQPAPDAVENSIAVMLEEAGLADLQNKTALEQETEVQETVPVAAQPRRTVRRSEDSSETPLGSLDRTKVSLGDSNVTTDSRRFLREHWGTEGTMIKILRNVKAGTAPITVRTLIEQGPVITGYRSIMAARCFSSILKLKQHSFIIVIKRPISCEIDDIQLGPKFDNIK